MKAKEVQEKVDKMLKIAVREKLFDIYPSLVHTYMDLLKFRFEHDKAIEVLDSEKADDVWLDERIKEMAKVKGVHSGVATGSRRGCRARGLLEEVYSSIKFPNYPPVKPCKYEASISSDLSKKIHNLLSEKE